MQETDKFHIFLIDKKITRFSTEGKLATLKNIQAAERFLEKEQSGGLFASNDMYISLEKFLPFISEDDEAHTVLLLTDGKTHLSNERKQKTLKKWTEKNQGRVALYPCAVGRDNDLLTLDMLSSISGGKLLYSDTHASLPRKLAKLVLDLKDPIAKDLIITAIASEEAHIELFPQQSSLYTHQPCVIVGEIDHPCKFDLIVQGRQRDQWIHLKKNISFKEGHKGTAALEKLWKSRQAQTYYGKFLDHGKSAALKVAKELLKTSRKEVVFE